MVVEKHDEKEKMSSKCRVDGIDYRRGCRSLMPIRRGRRGGSRGGRAKMSPREGESQNWRVLVTR